MAVRADDVVKNQLVSIRSKNGEIFFEGGFQGQVGNVMGRNGKEVDTTLDEPTLT